MNFRVEDLLTPEEVIRDYGRLLGTKSVKTLWELRRSGRLGYVRVGRKVLHRREHVEAYLQSCPEYGPNVANTVAPTA